MEENPFGIKSGSKVISGYFGVVWVLMGAILAFAAVALTQPSVQALNYSNPLKWSLLVTVAITALFVFVTISFGSLAIKYNNQSGKINDFFVDTFRAKIVKKDDEGYAMYKTLDDALEAIRTDEKAVRSRLQQKLAADKAKLEKVAKAEQERQKEVEAGLAAIKFFPSTPKQQNEPKQNQPKDQQQNPKQIAEAVAKALAGK